MPFPSDEQSEVIGYDGRALVVVAGPGTGKTRTLVERIICILDQDQSQEVSFITFTRTSRRDTERKLMESLGQESVEDHDRIFPRTSTLHGYAKRLVHKYGNSVGQDPRFSIPIDAKGERLLIVEEAALDIGIESDPELLLGALIQFRASNRWPDEFHISEDLRNDLAARYSEVLQIYRTLDMEGIVLAGCEILALPDSTLPPIYLHVDEFQDLNPNDQTFISLLSAHSASTIVVVGDDAQSIYGFRHSNLEGIQTLWGSNDWDQIHFPDSFRSGAHMLNAALDLIDGRGYLGGNINRKPENDLSIPVLQCTTAALQIEAIATDIRHRISNSIENQEQQLSPQDFLILCPTSSQVSQVVSRLEADFGLPAHSPSRSSIPDDYWHIILFLRIAGLSDPLATRQWFELVGLSHEEIIELRDVSIEAGISLMEACLGSSDERITSFTSQIEALQRNDLDPTDVIEILERLPVLSIPRDFCELMNSFVLEDGTSPAISQLITLMYEHFGVIEQGETVPDEDRILVATLHGSKGLEAKYVYCGWMSSSFMPMPNRDVEEQRRILYVVLTRAKNDILLTFPESYDPKRRRRLGREELSPFLEEISRHLWVYRANADLIRMQPPPWVN